MAKNDVDDYEIRLKEFGKPVFKAKGKKNKVKKELNEFFNFKLSKW